MWYIIRYSYVVPQMAPKRIQLMLHIDDRGTILDGGYVIARRDCRLHNAHGDGARSLLLFPRVRRSVR